MKKALFLVPAIFAVMAVSCNKPQEQAPAATEQPAATTQNTAATQQPAANDAKAATPAATTAGTEKKGK